MKKNIALLCLIALTGVMHAEVKVALNMSFGSQRFETTFLFENDGQWHKRSYQGLTIEAMAAPANDADVMVHMKMYVLDEQGTCHLFAAPVIQTPVDEVAEITMKSDSGDELNLTMLATR